MPSITPFLWFNNNAEEAIEFYTKLFPNSEIKHVQRWKEGGPLPAGTLLTASFVLNGQEVMVLNGGPHYELSPAFSFFVKCKDQEEVDFYWNAFTEEGGKSQCGWCVDKFGVSWQIIPDALGKLLSDPDPRRSSRAMQAMLKMNKIIVKDLEMAANSE